MAEILALNGTRRKRNPSAVLQRRRLAVGRLAARSDPEGPIEQTGLETEGECKKIGEKIAASLYVQS